MAVDPLLLIPTIPRLYLLLLGAPALLVCTACGPPTAQPDGGSADRLPVCQESCRAGSECSVGFECSGLSRCVATGTASHSCGSDDDCLRQLSGWTTGCSSTGTCSSAICVAVAEGRYCAGAPTASSSCAQRLMQEVTLPGPDGGQVTVCGKGGYLCQDNRCVKPCASDVDCLSPQLPLCNRSSGKCECQQTPTDSCQSNQAGGLLCRAGICGCASDVDCGGAGFDRCLQGKCACSGATVCEAISRLHPATHWVCAAPPSQ